VVDFLTLTANSNVSRLDIFDFSDFFDFQADVRPKINDLRNPGFGLWFALSLSKGKRTGSRAWAHGQVKHHAGSTSNRDWQTNTIVLAIAKTPAIDAP
jgi:hypothetical protein